MPKAPSKSSDNKKQSRISSFFHKRPLRESRDEPAQPAAVATPQRSLNDTAPAQYIAVATIQRIVDNAAPAEYAAVVATSQRSLDDTASAQPAAVATSQRSFDDTTPPQYAAVATSQRSLDDAAQAQAAAVATSQRSPDDAVQAQAAAVATSQRSPDDAAPAQPAAVATFLQNVVATGQSALVSAIRPFEDKGVYFCPFKAKGRKCDHKNGKFTSFEGLAQHVKLRHSKDGVITPYSESPFEDGTAKIPCPRGCGFLAVTHMKAFRHDKIVVCPVPPPKEVFCPWKLITGCNKKGSPRAMGSLHTSTHANDARSPYQCSVEGCGLYHADLYQLALHEERCPSKSIVRTTCHRYALNEVAERNPPSIIIIARTSSHYPETWKAGTGHVRTGLPIIGRQILEEYTAYQGDQTCAAAVIHACSNCPTRELPSLATSKSTIPKDLSQTERQLQHRSFEFTRAIFSDIKAANEVGITPILLSLGADGWACDERKIIPWLQASPELDFQLVLRMNCLLCGMSDAFVEKTNRVYWATYQSQRLLRAYEQGPGHDPRYDELVSTWRTLQVGKDAKVGASIGRNVVDLTNT